MASILVEFARMGAQFVISHPTIASPMTMADGILHSKYLALMYLLALSTLIYHHIEIIKYG